jgi:hypothetical protein
MSPHRADSHIRHCDSAVATCILDDVVYCVHVRKDDEGRTTISFSSSHPPRGLDTTLYQWHGRLTTAPRRPYNYCALCGYMFTDEPLKPCRCGAMEAVDA